MVEEASALNEAVEQSDPPASSTADTPADSGGQGATPTAAQGDATDVLALLDDLEDGQAQTTDRTGNNAPLTAEEHARMAELLGDAQPTRTGKSRAQQYAPPPVATAEMAQNYEFPPVAASEMAQHSTLGREIDDLLTHIQTQIEAVIAEHDLLSKKLTLTKARVRELESGQPGGEGSALTQIERNENAEYLRSEMTELSQRQEGLTAQLHKLLGPFETANMAPAAPGADLLRARETLGNLQKKLSSRAETFMNDDAWEISAPTQRMDQTAAPATAHEKVLHQSSKQQEAVKILRELQSRLRPLTGLDL